MLKLNAIILLIGLAFILGLSGCIAGGGGGSYHIPPQRLRVGLNQLRLELTPANGSYTKVVCVYSVDNGTAVSLPMRDMGSAGDRRIYECSMPLELAMVGKKVGYSFSYVHGSATNNRTESPIVIEAEPVPIPPFPSPIAPSPPPSK